MADEQELMGDQQEEQTPEQGPGPQPALSEENRKKLDSIVSQMVANKESDDNIKKVVEDFKGKYSTPVNLGKISAPVQKQVSESTAAPKITLPKVLPGTSLDRMTIEKNKAHEILSNELTGNKDLITPLIKKQKGQELASQNLTNFAQAPRSDQPLTVAQKFAASVAPKTPDVAVTNEDISNFQQNIASNEEASRRFLHHIADNKPDKAKAIQAALYTADAAKRADEDPSKVQTILQNVKNIEDGKLVYNIQGGH